MFFKEMHVIFCYKFNHVHCNCYMKDADGGIWAVSLHADGGLPSRLLSCHAGSVADMAASPVGHFLATLGTNGCLLVHDVMKKELLLSHRFKALGNSLVWIPTHVRRTPFHCNFCTLKLQLFIV